MYRQPTFGSGITNNPHPGPPPGEGALFCGAALSCAGTWGVGGGMWAGHESKTGLLAQTLPTTFQRLNRGYWARHRPRLVGFAGTWDVGGRE